MDSLQRAILTVLAEHVGPDARISRPDLLEAVNAERRNPVSDRAMRRAIEELRSTNRSGAYICAAYPSDGVSGYFLASSKSEALDYMRPDWKRVGELSERLKAQERLLTGNDAQMAMM